MDLQNAFFKKHFISTVQTEQDILVAFFFLVFYFILFAYFKKKISHFTYILPIFHQNLVQKILTTRTFWDNEETEIFYS